MRIAASGGPSSRLARLATIPVVGLVLAACTDQENTNPTGDEAAPNLFGETASGIGFPHEVVTSEGIASAGLYLPIFLVAVVIFLLIEGLLLFLVFRYRRKDGDDSMPEQTHGNNVLEVAWTAIPALIVTLMFIGSTIVLTEVEAKSDEQAAVIDVEAFRFGWKFDYMDPTSIDADTGRYDPLEIQIAGGGREGAPEMVVPTDEPVLFLLTAADVIHSFYVPAFFFKRDAIPGRVNEFEVTIEVPGSYGGQCAEFCGLAHGDMFFSVCAVEPSAYDSWVASGGTTVAAEYCKGGETEPAEAGAEAADAEAEGSGTEATDAEADGTEGATDTSEEAA